jgi:hypothetical protein
MPSAASASKIIDAKADYVLALKGHQGSLREDVELLGSSKTPPSPRMPPAVDGGHSRIETRTVIHSVAWLRRRHEWPGLNGIDMIESSRELMDRTETDTSLTLPTKETAPWCAIIGPSRTPCTGSWTWSFATTNAACEPNMLPQTSQPSSTSPAISPAALKPRNQSASAEKSLPGRRIPRKPHLSMCV